MLFDRRAGVVGGLGPVHVWFSDRNEVFVQDRDRVLEVVVGEFDSDEY